MKQVVDFRAEHEAALQQIMHGTDCIPPNQDIWNRFIGLADIASQFQKEKDAEKWSLLESTFFPILCQLAELQGGRVELDIDETALVGKLIYTGKNLILSDIFHPDLKQFSSIFSSANDMELFVREDSFSLQFLFELYHRTAGDEYRAGI